MSTADEGEPARPRRRRARQAAATPTEDDVSREANAGLGDAPPEYEFDDLENEMIRRLATKMRFVGSVGLGGGALATLYSLVTLFQTSSLPGAIAGVASLVTVVGLAVSIVSMLTALWTLRAAQSFRNVVDTRQTDVHHLMVALGQLDRVYLVQTVLAGLTLFFFALGLMRAALDAAG